MQEAGAEAKESATGGARGRGWKFPKPSVGAAAFLLSLTLALLSLAETLRGPEIEVAPPKQVLLYRSGGTLNLALHLPMINKAAGYNDMIVGLKIQPSPGEPVFTAGEIATPVFNDKAVPDKAAKHCISPYRCQSLRKMAISQREDEMIVIPGGGAHAFYYSAELYCADSPGCGAYKNLAAAMQRVSSTGLDVTMRVAFYRDGERTIKCRAEPVAPDDFWAYGWLYLNCVASSVSD